MRRMSHGLLVALAVFMSFALARMCAGSCSAVSATVGIAEAGVAGASVSDLHKYTSAFQDSLDLVGDKCGVDGVYVIHVDRSCVLSAGRTFGGNVYFEVEPGAEIVVRDGQTLGISSPSHVRCPERQKIFSCSGMGKVAFGNGGTLYPGWWGAVADGMTDDSPAIQAAIDAGTNGSTVFYPPGVYLIGTPLDPRLRQHLGSHCAASVFCAGVGNEDAIFKFSSMRGQMFVKLGFRSANRHAYAFKSVSLSSYADSVLWRDCEFFNEFHTDVSALLGNCLFDRCHFGYLGNGPYEVHRHVYSGDATGRRATFTNTFRQCWFLNSTGIDASVHFVSGNTLLFESCIWQGCATPAVKAEGVMNVLFENCNWEDVEPGLVDPSNCVIHMDADPTNRGVGRLTLRHCWFQNNGKKNNQKWAAVARLSSSGGDAKAVFDSCAGNLGSYWTLTGSQYDLPANTTVINSNCVNITGKGGLFGQGYSIGPTIRANNPVPFSVSDPNTLSAMTNAGQHRDKDETRGPELTVRNVQTGTWRFERSCLYIIDSSQGRVSGALADGTVVGQRVKFVCKAAGHDIDILVSHHVMNDPQVIRLDAPREWVELVWDGVDWVETGGMGQSYPQDPSG